MTRSILSLTALLVGAGACGANEPGRFAGQWKTTVGPVERVELRRLIARLHRECMPCCESNHGEGTCSLRNGRAFALRYRFEGRKNPGNPDRVAVEALEGDPRRFDERLIRVLRQSDDPAKPIDPAS